MNLRWIVALLLGLVAVPGLAQVNVGDTIELTATHHLGVPLHVDPDPPFDDFSRVPDRAHATVLEQRDGGRWNRIRVTADSREGWIVERYIFRVIGAPQPSPDDGEAEVWASKAQCEAAFAAGKRMRRGDPAALRVATWNIRWFPKGCSPDQTCPESATNIDWLACTIAWMELDVLAVQEILDRSDDRLQMALLIDKIETLGGGDWEVDLNDCGAARSQHVGFLWNKNTVSLFNQSDEEQLNGRFTGGSACAGNLRPGRYARASSVTAGGVDFHVLSVHLDSGVAQRDFDTRRAAIEEVNQLEIGGQALSSIGDATNGGAGDNDILVIGDWNTMGMTTPNPVTASEELALFDAELEPGFERLVPTPACSEYFNGKGGLLDHVVPSLGMEEASAVVHLTGYCSVLDCADFGSTIPQAYEVLSDHCPLVVEIRDEDVD